MRTTGARFIAKDRGIINSMSSAKTRVERAVKESPWLVARVLAFMSENERQQLKWVAARI